MNTPKVVRSGTLKIFNDMPCYVLDDGQRIFRFSHLMVGLRGEEHGKHGKIGNYLSSANILKYLPERLHPLTDQVNDRVPQGVIEFELDEKIERGYNSEDFMDVCTAFVKAFYNGEKLSEPQQEIVKNANTFILSCAKIGIIALIDEATGFQFERDNKELQLKLSYYLLDENEKARDWEKTFPNELWFEFGRLTNWKGSIKKRPKYWGKLVNALIYDCLDIDVAKHLRENKPPKYTGQKYFQWLNEERGIKELTQHIWQIIGMAKTCENINELKELASKKFDKKIDL